MKYFKELEDKYINKPFLITEPNVDHDIFVNKIIPNEFYLRHLPLLRKLYYINKHLSLISLRTRAAKLENRQEDNFEDFISQIDENDPEAMELMISEVTKRAVARDSRSFEDHDLIGEIRTLALSLSTQRANELIRLYDDIDFTNPENTPKIKQLLAEMKTIVDSDKINLYGLGYEKSNEIEDLFYGFESCDSEYTYVHELFNNPVWTYNDAIRILSFYYDLLKIANLADDSIIKEIENAFEDLKQYKTYIHIPKNPDKPDYVSYPVPEAWYILPGVENFEDTLYNTTGQGGHKEATLEYLELDILRGARFDQSDVQKYLDETKELMVEDFVREGVYFHTIKYGLSVYHPLRFYDSNGEPYGVRKTALNFQKSERMESLYNLRFLPPEDKKHEFLEYFYEHSKYFNILDANGLPYGYLDIIKKAYEYVGLESDSIYMPGKCYAGDATYLLHYFGREVIYNDEANRFDIDDYEWSKPYLFSQTAKKLVVGVSYAHALMTQFFADLNKYAKDYKACIKYLRRFSLDHLLIRACGFNKVTRQINGNDSYKVILTSNPNYEQEFKEYLDNGWNVEYLPPIVINKETGELVDYLTSCEDIKTVLCPHEKILRFSNLSERTKQHML